MLKHVHNTLARRNSANKTNGKEKRPPSPAPSAVSSSSCSSLTSASSVSSIFFAAAAAASTPNKTGTSSSSSSSTRMYDALTLSPGSSSGASSSGYSSSLNWSRRARRASISSSSSVGVGAAGGGGAGSRLSISSVGSSVDGSGGAHKMVPLRIYTDNGCLRPDIQYKTVPVTLATTCTEIIHLILTKCKIRYKDPRLYGLAMELRLRSPQGAGAGEESSVAVPLEEGACPLRLLECYPKGGARFTMRVNMAEAKLVKIHDETELLGWLYKSILISEKTTASELIDILTRFTPPKIVGVGAGARHELDKALQCRGTRFELQLQVNEAWNRTLAPSDLVAPALIQSSSPAKRLILRRERPPLPPRPTNTISLYENVFSNISPTSSIASSSGSSSYSETSSTASTNAAAGHRSCPKCSAEYWRRRRSQSLSLSSGNSASVEEEGEVEDEDEDALLLQAFKLFDVNQLQLQDGRRSHSSGVRYEFFV